MDNYTRITRATDALRSIIIEPNYLVHPEGSVLISCGNTKIICTASIEDKVPHFLKNTGRGWVTAEYGMLPRSTATRMRRESTAGKQGGRTQEIQRLIGRSLRSAINLEKLGERQIIIDCDVIQADGGTRTASITGGYIAMFLAVQYLVKNGILSENPIRTQVAAVSVGIVNSIALLDLDYIEDSGCDSDMNIVMTADGNIVEIQGTAEGKTFSMVELDNLMVLAKQGIEQLFAKQLEIMNL